MLNRTDAILAGFTSVAVITICFLTYQMLKEPETKVAKVRPTQAISTSVVFSDAQKRARSRQVREQVKKLNPTNARRGCRYGLEDQDSVSQAIDAIEHQAMEVNVEIGGGAKALDEGHRASVRLGAGQSGLVDHKGRKGAMDHLQHG